MCNNETLPSTKYTVKEPFWKRAVDLVVIMGRQHYELDNEAVEHEAVLNTWILYTKKLTRITLDQVT